MQRKLFLCSIIAVAVVRCITIFTPVQTMYATPINQPSPTSTPYPTLQNIVTVSAGSKHTCALTSDRGVKCWGKNHHEQLGDGTTTDSYIPTDVQGFMTGASVLDAGLNSNCLVTIVGQVSCWPGGRLSGAQLIPPTEHLTDIVKAVAVGDPHTCVLTTSGGVKCWGANTFGNLGNGTTETTEESYVPADVHGLTSGVSAIAAGDWYTCAVIDSGGVKCWGYNFFGQLGDDTKVVSRTTPVDVFDLTSGAIAITTGRVHTCALMNTGGVKCWGSNTRGQLGNGSEVSLILHPVDVAGLTTGVKAITAGFFHTCALTDAGGVKCWGAINALGAGETDIDWYSSTPIDVVGLSAGVTAIAAGDEHTCAVTELGGVKCWGAIGTGKWELWLLVPTPRQ